MLRLIPLLLVFGCAAHAANIALLIGIGKYQKEFLEGPGGVKIPTALKGIDLDLENMRKTAKILGFKDTEIRVLFNEQATLAAIREALQQIARTTTARDRVLIYYSGHGSQTPDLNHDEADGLDEVIVPYDFDRTPKGFVNVLIDDEMATLLAAIPSDNTLLILDSCNSGTADRGFSMDSKNLSKSVDAAAIQYKVLPGDFPPVEAKDIDVRAKPAGAFTASTDRYVAIMAAQEDEFASATPSGSILTNAITQAVAKAATGNTPVTAERLYEYAAAEADKFCKQAQAAGRPAKQHPQLTGNPARKGINLRIVQDYFGMVSEWSDSVKAKLDFTIDKQSVKSGEVINISLKNAPRAGYLNVIQVGSVTNEARVLFPNKYFNGSNKVEKGQTIALPSPDQRFEFYAKPPAGAKSERVVLVAILTEKPKNLFTSSEDVTSSFRRLSVSDERDFEVRERTAGEEALYTGKIIVEVSQ
jgi:hypothetical protein